MLVHRCRAKYLGKSGATAPKKIPQVVAFNYLSAKEPPTIECHALYMDSAAEAQMFVEAITAAFNNAYKTPYSFETESIGSDAESKESTISCSDSGQPKKSPWMDKISDIFGVFSLKKIR
ncbi:hypothetical protein AC249_AIPGENE22430 [Exaiptasia diaphana]|nr:hypothetical protein AC249_AIPGENE22430 [Exaiptasia diaphana]